MPWAVGALARLFWLSDTCPSSDLGRLPNLRLQLDRMHAIPVGLKPVWDRDFLALLYDTITLKTQDEFGNEVFNRVERTFCCGLQSADPAVRKKACGCWVLHAAATLRHSSLPQTGPCSTGRILHRPARTPTQCLRAAVFPPICRPCTAQPV